MWLIKPDVLQAMRNARALGYQPTLEERARFAAQMREAYASKSGEQPENMVFAGSIAQINIEGVLTEKPDCFALLFGGGNTTYESIRKGLALADADPSIKSIVLNIASPGGHVNGLFETFAALDAVTKPISVRSNFAASAAYGLAAVAGPIEATTPAAEFGSIGVAASYFVEEEVIDIASTEAPKKRPDLTTEEGKAVVREELDALHELFAGYIARGRAATTGEDVTIATVNAEFGQGGMFTAGTAKKRGMVDKVAAQPKRTRMGKGADFDGDRSAALAPVTIGGLEIVEASTKDGRRLVTTDGMTWTEKLEAAGKPPSQEANAEPAAPAAVPVETKDASAARGGAADRSKQMNEKELQEQHPELYDAVLNKGATTERKRCVDHIKLGKACKDFAIAHKAIAEGSSVSDMQADYLAANMNSKAIEDRQVESDEAGKAADGAKKDAAKKGVEEETADLVADIMDGKVKL